MDENFMRKASSQICLRMTFCMSLLLITHSAFAKKPKIFTTYESLETQKTSRELAEPGKMTIVEYYVDWCETCKLMPDYYKIWIQHQPNTAIKRVHLPRDFDFASVSKRHWIQMCGVPHFEIIAADGSEFLKDRCQDNVAFQYIFKFIFAMQAEDQQQSQ